MVAADFEAYAEAQRRVDALWVDEEAWYGRTILNTVAHGMVFFRPHHSPVCEGNLESRPMTEKGTVRDADKTGFALTADEAEAIASGAHADPFSVLGVHTVG
jgi:hypothetical protein